MKKTILFGVACLLLAGFAAAQQAATRPANGDGVPIEEYVPKVIIEGKWGTGPGEFGVYDEPWAGIDYRPGSLAVDSRGDIYVLDFVNDRIQKFTSSGKYSLSIPVEGFSGDRQEAETTVMVDRDHPDVNVPPGHPRRIDRRKRFIKITPDFKTIGINIVMDSKDTLYYYLKRIKDGKETGEVWEFKKDKLVGKINVPVTNSLSAGVGLEIGWEDDSLIIPNVDKHQRGRHYDVRKEKVISTAQVREMRAKFRAHKAGKKLSAKPVPEDYLDIETSDAGVKVVKKKN